MGYKDRVESAISRLNPLWLSLKKQIWRALRWSINPEMFTGHTGPVWCPVSSQNIHIESLYYPDYQEFTAFMSVCHLTNFTVAWQKGAFDLQTLQAKLGPPALVGICQCWLHAAPPVLVLVERAAGKRGGWGRGRSCCLSGCWAHLRSLQTCCLDATWWNFFHCQKIFVQDEQGKCQFTCDVLLSIAWILHIKKRSHPSEQWFPPLV